MTAELGELPTPDGTAHCRNYPYTRHCPAQFGEAGCPLFRCERHQGIDPAVWMLDHAVRSNASECPCGASPAHPAAEHPVAAEHSPAPVNAGSCRHMQLGECRRSTCLWPSCVAGGK